MQPPTQKKWNVYNPLRSGVEVGDVGEDENTQV